MPVWDRLEERRACRISVTRLGSVESSSDELADFRKWQIKCLLIFKCVFAPLVKTELKAIGSS